MRTTCNGHAQIHPFGMQPMLTSMTCYEVPNGGSRTSVTRVPVTGCNDVLGRRLGRPGCWARLAVLLGSSGGSE